MASNSEYQKACETYHALLAKSRLGDLKAKKEKAAAYNQVREIERAAAKEGVVLDHNVDGAGRVTVKETKSHRKRSLQEEYIRKFDAETPVKIVTPTSEQVTTLNELHSKRLLGK